MTQTPPPFSRPPTVSWLRAACLVLASLIAMPLAMAGDGPTAEGDPGHAPDHGSFLDHGVGHAHGHAHRAGHSHDGGRRHRHGDPHHGTSQTTATDDPPASDSPQRPRFITDRPGLDLPLPGEDEAFTFAIFGDRTGGPAAGVSVLADAVRDVNLIGPDMVMTVGDLIEGYSGVGPWMEQMREFRGIMDELDCPWFPVAGNHDIYWRGPNRPAEEHERRYEEHFGPLWYAFRHKGSLFVSLYSDEANPRTGERNFNRADSQRMSAEQLAWLTETLAGHRDAEHVFIFIHHPRWTGGNYGDDWERVHRVLVDAGNVRAVFGGHIHRMRYDPRDGIEYVTLATVGGHQRGLSPDGGWLHEFHLVTVRPDRIAMAAVPVATILDPRALTGDLTAELQRIATADLPVRTSAVLAADGSASGEFTLTIANPTALPIDVTVLPSAASVASGWRFGPDHAHQRVAPGSSADLTMALARHPRAVDAALVLPSIDVTAEALAAGRRYAIAPRTAHLHPVVSIPDGERQLAGRAGAVDRALDFDGRDDHLRIEAAAIDIPDGPFTVEGWLRADRFGGRTGFICRTESSEWGIFVSGGVPSFMVHLDGRYVTASAAGADDATLLPNRWHHVAGVFDGQEVRLYIDGRRVAAVPGRGTRSPNDLPIIIGGDVDGAGRPVSFFDGQIDEVRIRAGAAYTGERFTPVATAAASADDRVHLRLDRSYGPWWLDGSAFAGHAIGVGGPEHVEADGKPRD